MRIKQLLLALPLWLSCGGPSAPAAAPEPIGADTESGESLIDFDPETLVGLELLADVESLPVDGQATIGALFKIQEGWHLYWINPGESGLPTKVSVDQRPGLVVGSARYPGPIRFDSDGEIINYGYHHELLLPMPVTEIQTGEPVELKVSASWLACREDACVPGKASATLTLARSPGPAKPSAEAKRFEDNAALLPKAFAELATHGVEAEVVALDEGGARIHLRAPQAYSLTVFPIEDKALSDLKSSESGTEFTLHPVSGKTDLLVLAVGRDSVTNYFSLGADLFSEPAKSKGSK